MRLPFIIPCLLGAVSVVLFALGSHALAGHLSPSEIRSFNIGVHLMILHLIVMLIFAQFYSESIFFKTSYWLFLTGILLFSVSLIIASSFHLPAFRKLTPFGGLTHISAWLVTAWAFFKRKTS